MLHYLQMALHHFGYGAVALFMITEGCGIPVPAETMLVTAAAFSARGTLSVWGVIAAGSVGGVLGGTAGYAIGAVGGLRLIRRHGSRFGLDESKLQGARTFFRQRGIAAVVLARFLAFFRILVPMLAGVTEMPFARFSVYNAIGSIGAAIAYGGLGYQFGRDLPALEHHLQLVTLIVLAAAVIVGGGLWWRRARHRVAASE